MSKRSDTIHDAIPFHDLLALLRKNVLKILLSLCLGALVMGAFALSRPIRYQAEATFKDKGSARDLFGPPTITSLLSSGITNKYVSEAKAIMISRRLLETVIDALNLQASVKEISSGSGIARTFQDNIIIEHSYLRNLQNYPIKDPKSKISISAIVYHEQIPQTLKLVFEGNSQFHVFDLQTNENLGSGIYGNPFTGKNFAFTVDSNDSSLPCNATFIATLLPMERLVKNLRARLEILPDPEDASLLTLSFSDSNRQLSAQFLNTLMQKYQDYLSQEQDRISSEQIAYLNRRENELGKNLEKVLTTYADQLSDELNDNCCIESEKGIEFLTKELQSLRQKEISGILDLQRLEELNIEHCVYQGQENFLLFDNLVTKIRELDAQSDQMELALRSSNSNSIAEWQTNFDKQIQELADIRHSQEDAQIILTSLKSEKYPLPAVHLMEHPRYMVSSWHEELNRCLEKLKTASPWEKDACKETLDLYRLQFIGYLNHLLHFLEVSQKTVKERLEHQQTPHFEFQGINLSSASDLYISYIKEHSGLENQILQYQFMIDQLNTPGFEISSFSSTIDNDPISLDVMKKASNFVVAIQDDANRGIKEKERYKTELETLKKFYSVHLNQTVELAKLKQAQLKNTIESLQSALLELIKQQRSILENQLMEVVESQTERLKQEQKLIAQQIGNIREELHKLPQKWASEKFIEHQIAMNARMVEELAKLVESKNISHSLEIIQAAPLDLATPPLKPVRPLFLLYASLGGVLGFCLFSGYVLLRAAVSGFPASKESLHCAGVEVKGTLSNLKETQMRVVAQILRNERKEFAVIGEAACHFSRGIAAQIAAQDQKVLLVEVGRENRQDSASSFDQIFIEDTSFKVHTLSKECKKQGPYDCVVISAAVRPLSQVAEVILDQVDTACILLSHETTPQLQPLIQRAEKQDVSFILN